jgi:hypothetical protein
VAWIRIAGQAGEVLAASAGAPAGAVPEATLHGLLVERVQSVHQVLASKMGMPTLVVVSLPFRFRFADERPGGEPVDPPGRPRFIVLRCLGGRPASRSLGALRRTRVFGSIAMASGESNCRRA